MNTYFKVFLVTMFCLVLGVGTNHAQNYQEMLYELYVQSVMEPESFDEVILIKSTQGMFNNSFNSHLNCVQRRLLELNQEQIENCKQIGNPQLRWQCMQRNVVISAYLWSESVRQVIRGKKLWAQTPTGSAIIAGKRIIEETGMDPQLVLKRVLQPLKQQLMISFTCN